MPEARNGSALDWLWQALRAGFGLPQGPRWWVGSVSAWRCGDALAACLLGWPAWPASGFEPRYPLVEPVPTAVGLPGKLPAHWRLFERAAARRLAAGSDPLLDGAPDVLLAIDWQAPTPKRSSNE